MAAHKSFQNFNWAEKMQPKNKVEKLEMSTVQQ
jgi:hypothetical protein